MTLLMAIDGACRRNGRPDCTASGGVFIRGIDEDGNCVGYATKSAFEYGSTNQRGELLALLIALRVTYKRQCEAHIITDSEYLFNAMTKQWYKNWRYNDWKTREGSDVKNRDIWELIAALADKCELLGYEVSFYHIKGHVIPFGAVTARNTLVDDNTGEKLYKLACDKFDAVAPTKIDALKYASNLSVKNNGFPLDLNGPILKDWVTANVVADAIATKAVDEADSRRET